MGKNKAPTSSLVDTRLTRLDPWAVGRSVFLVAVSLALVFLMATGLTWYLIESLGVWARINAAVTSVVGEDAAFSVQKYLSLKNSLIISFLLSLVNVIGVTLLAILSSYLFNAWTAIFRGPTMTLALPALEEPAPAASEPNEELS